MTAIRVVIVLNLETVSLKKNFATRVVVRDKNFPIIPKEENIHQEMVLKQEIFLQLRTSWYKNEKMLNMLNFNF